ncbi:MAG: putative glycoside hydrolase [Bacillota bacterium]|nr:putative glycoside hydrolase [Bacillota bacterium]
MKKKYIVACIAVVVALAAVSGSVLAYRALTKTTEVSKETSTISTKSSAVQSSNSSQSSTANTQSTANNPKSTAQGNSTDPSVITVQAPDKNFKVKGLYLTGWTAGSDKNLQHYVDLAKKTEINTYVVDIKDDDGYVGYESQIPEVRSINGWEKKYDVDKMIKTFHDNGIHVIGRIVCFKDTILSSQKPELAIKDTRGGLYKTRNTDGKYITWLNPYEKGSWSYLTDIAKEAIQKGFDEIQFDYVRFANDGQPKYMDFSAYTQPKYEAIDGFLAYARQQLPGVVLSADIFGIVCESPADTEKIGQYLENIGKDIDYISPMAYPSHYALGQEVNGVTFSKPDFEPYKVVYNTLLKAKNRIAAVSDYQASVRPYLQDFTATWIGKGNYQKYGPEQVKEQIQAVYDAGYDQWILWDANNKYDESAFAPKK